MHWPGFLVGGVSAADLSRSWVQFPKENTRAKGLTSGETGFRLAGRFAMEDSGVILEESQDSGMILEERRELADENFGNAGVPQQACLAAQLLSTSW